MFFKSYFFNVFCTSSFTKKKKKGFKTSRYGSLVIFNALRIALKFPMTLKNLSLFQWQPTNNRVTLANIDNKYNKMKETAYVQSITKHLFENIPAASGIFGRATSGET